MKNQSGIKQKVFKILETRITKLHPDIYVIRRNRYVGKFCYPNKFNNDPVVRGINNAKYFIWLE